MMINLQGKTALVTGVADNIGFGWHIAKALASNGADIILSCHPRVESIVERFLTKDKYAESRLLDNGQELCPKMLISCDVAYDFLTDLRPEQALDKGYANKDISIAGLAEIFEKIRSYTRHRSAFVGFFARN